MDSGGGGGDPDCIILDNRQECCGSLNCTTNRSKNTDINNSLAGGAADCFAWFGP